MIAQRFTDAELDAIEAASKRRNAADNTVSRLAAELRTTRQQRDAKERERVEAVEASLAWHELLTEVDAYVGSEDEYPESEIPARVRAALTERDTQIAAGIQWLDDFDAHGILDVNAFHKALRRALSDPNPEP